MYRWIPGPSTGWHFVWIDWRASANDTLGMCSIEFALFCPFKQCDGLRHLVMSRSRIVVEPVCLNEHVVHLLFQELTRVRRPHFTAGDCRQYITLNDVFELGRQRCGRKIRQIFNPLLHESFKLLSLARRILTPYSSAIELLHSLYGRRRKCWNRNLDKPIPSLA